MHELICHLIGDYVLQDHWQANAKRRYWAPALIHALLYGLPFLVLGPSLAAWVVIVGSHAVIDHYGLAGYWARFWGVGSNGGWFCRHVGVRIERWQWPIARQEAAALAQNQRDWAAGKHAGSPVPVGPVGMSSEPPAYLAVWLAIILDNTLHLLINHLALAYC